ncbi:MAG: efflux RND transporter periplasmic adaptor subunit [Desulfobacteraceae bacterium]|nr:efflux RND transporter periplasmic adaptor subunit [Desulfobacteraceae bacterium]
MNKRIAVVILIILIVLGLLWKIFKNDASVKKVEAPPEKTAIARIWPFKMLVDATGRVTPEREVAIKCKASGEVVKVPVEMSQAVKKGDLLAQLDPGQEERGVGRAQAELTAARAQAAQARLNLTVAERDLVSEGERAKSAEQAAQAKASEEQAKEGRAEALFAKKMISQEELEAAKSANAAAQAGLKDAQARVRDVGSKKDRVEARRQEVSEATAQVEATRLRLADAEERLADTKILSPLDGVVASCNVQAGQIISSGIDTVGGGTTIMTVDDLSRTYVLVAVDESDIGKVAPGQPAKIRVDAYPDQVFNGEVALVGNRGINNSSMITFEVKVEVKDDKRDLLKPEMTANVSIVTKDKLDSLLVPVSALERRKGLSWVTVKKKDGSTSRRLVVIGDSNSEFVEILKGLEVGERVVLTPEGGLSRWQADRQGKDGQGGKRLDRGAKLRLMGFDRDVK